MPDTMDSPALASLGYWVYTGLSMALSPGYALQLAVRHARGLEPAGSTYERLGSGSVPRPKGPVLWFHALSIGESAVALPVIFRCLLEYNENVHVLLTTGTPEAHSLLASSLPRRVIVQYVPFESPLAVARFLRHWQPQVGLFMESPAWPILVEGAARAGVRLGLLNARMSSSSFLKWFMRRMSRALLSRLLSHFSLIVPQSDVDVGRFRILGATLSQMPGWCSDLKYAAALGTSVWHLWRPSPARIRSVKRAAGGRPMWVAASTHDGEEVVVAGVHKSLRREWPDLLTLLVPRHSARCPELLEELREEGLVVGLWSELLEGEECAPLTGFEVVLVDIIPDLPLLYSVSEIAFIGNSLLEGCSGHNLAEAAVAGCAVLVGEHAGHFSQMAEELNQAAVMAAEEAAAAVNSSGPMLEEAFAYAAEAHAAEGTAAASPRDARHWRGVLDDHPRAAGDRAGTSGGTGSAGVSRQISGGGGASSSRPSTAPAAVAYAGADVRAAAAGVQRAGSSGSCRQQHGSSQSLALLSEGSTPRHGSEGYDATAPFRRSEDAYRHLEPPAVPPPSADANTPANTTAAATPVAGAGYGRQQLESADAELLREGVMLDSDGGSSSDGDSQCSELLTSREAAAALLGETGVSSSSGSASASSSSAWPAVCRRQRPASAGRSRPPDRPQVNSSQSAGVGWAGGASGDAHHPTAAAAAWRGGHRVGSPLCPPTPTTPAPTPVGSAQALGGRSPSASYSGQPSTLSHPVSWTPCALDRVAAAAAEAAAAVVALGGGDSVRSSTDGNGMWLPPPPAVTPRQDSGVQGRAACGTHQQGADAAAGDSEAGNSEEQRPMGRSPTLSELCSAASSSSNGSGQQQQQQQPGQQQEADGEGTPGLGPVELNPGPAAIAAAVGALPGVTPYMRQGSMGWEGWAGPPADLPQEGAAVAVAVAAAPGVAPGDGVGEGEGGHLFREVTLAPSEGVATAAAGSSGSGPTGPCCEGGVEFVPCNGCKAPAQQGSIAAGGVAAQHAPSTPTQAAAAAAASGDISSSSSASSSPVQDGGAALQQPAQQPAGTTAQPGPGPSSGSSSSSNGVGYRRTTSSSAGGGPVEPSPLGDPGRSAHFLDPLMPQAPRRLALPQGAGGSSTSSTSRALALAAAANAAAAAAVGGGLEAAGPSAGPSADGTPVGWVEGGRGGWPPHLLHHQPSWEGSLGADTSDAGGLDTGGAATPTSMSGYSPMSQATTDAATPSWQSSSTWGEVPGSGRSSWRGPGQHNPFTPRLPCHEEADVSSDGCGPSDAGGEGDGGDTPPGWSHHRSAAAAAAAAGGGRASGKPPSPQQQKGHGAGGSGGSGHSSGAAADGGEGAAPVGTSYLRYRGEYILPATHLPYSPAGPAVWRVSGAEGLTQAVATLLREPLERRSRGHAAAQAAAKLASGLVATVWHVVDDMVITPALQAYVTAQGGSGGAASTAASRVPGHPRH